MRQKAHLSPCRITCKFALISARAFDANRPLSPPVYRRCFAFVSSQRIIWRFPGGSYMSPRFEQDPSVLATFAWSESIIADVLQRFYDEQSPDGASTQRLLPLHLYFWKVLIFGSEAVSCKQRRALLAAAFDAGLDSALLSEIDAEVMAELLEIILRRYRATPHDARQYHQLLLSVAARLRAAAFADPVDASRSRLYDAASPGTYS
jgi:hypothetical protein